MLVPIRSRVSNYTPNPQTHSANIGYNKSTAGPRHNATQPAGTTPVR